MILPTLNIYFEQKNMLSFLDYFIERNGPHLKCNLFIGLKGHLGTSGRDCTIVKPTNQLMECDVAGAIRGGGFEHFDQIPNSIEVKAITDPLKILKNGLEGENPEAHHRRGEARHPHISTDVDKNTLPILSLHLLKQVLHRGGDIGAAEGLALERADDVLVGLVGQSAEVGERVEEGEFETLDGVGDDGVGLRGGEAVERVDGSVGSRIFEGFDFGICGGGLGGEI